MSEIRQAALEAVIDILERNVNVEEAMSSTLINYNLSKKDKSLFTELVYGTTRNKLTLDFIISKISKREFKDLSYNLRNILRLAVYQLENTRIPDYAIVNTSVELTRTVDNEENVPFINGVLRNLIKKRQNIKFPKISSNPAYALSIKYSHPKWMVQRWLDLYGMENTISLLSYNNMASQTYISINRIKSNIKEVIQELEEGHIKPTVSTISADCLKLGNVGSIPDLPGFYEGHWFVQDEVSALAVDVLCPGEGETIVDVCAAPGSKTARIASYLNNKGKIFALEINPERLKKINENCYRLGITCVESIIADSTKFQLPENCLADKVILDAPCTNTGVFSKRADARWKRKPNDLKKLSNLQFELLSNSSNFLKPGGTIVYSVCSIEPDEGINVIKRFLNTRNDFKLLNINKYLPDNLKNAFNEEYALFLPFKTLTDGFFIAIVTKHC